MSVLVKLDLSRDLVRALDLSLLMVVKPKSQVEWSVIEEKYGIFDHTKLVPVRDVVHHEGVPSYLWVRCKDAVIDLGKNILVGNKTGWSKSPIHKVIETLIEIGDTEDSVYLSKEDRDIVEKFAYRLG